MSASIVTRGKDYSATPVEADIRALLDGMVFNSWVQAMIARGYGWHTDVGAFSTPIQGGGAGTIFDQDQPEIGIEIPSGYTLVPLRVHIACQVPLSAADSDEIEILIAADRAAAAAGLSGNSTLEVPTNMRTGITTGTPCNTYSACTVNCTNPTLNIELAHVVKVLELGSDVGRNWTDLSLLYEPLVLPFLVGPAGFYAYWGGTVAVTGFANLDYLAFPSSLLTGLS